MLDQVSDFGHAMPAVTAIPASGGDRLTDAFALIGALMRFDRNAEIFGEGEPAEFFYEVVTGAVRTYKLLEDGRRQIGAFYLPDDVFGIEEGAEHGFTAEAIANTCVRVAKRSTIVTMARSDSALASQLWGRTAGCLRAARDHMLLLGRKNAEEKVAAFLLDMARREASDQVVELPMSRQDIADYLGLTIETVSRTLTLLEDKDAIRLPSSRRIALVSRAKLQRLNA